MIGRRALARRFTELEADAHLPIDAVVAFVDGELGAAAHQRVGQHLSRCADCSAEVAAQRRTRGVLRSAQVPSPPDGLLAALQSIPHTAELPELSGTLAIARDGTVVSETEAGRVQG